METLWMSTSHDKNDDIQIDSIENLKILNNDLTIAPQSKNIKEVW